MTLAVLVDFLVLGTVLGKSDGREILLGLTFSTSWRSGVFSASKSSKARSLALSSAISTVSAAAKPVTTVFPSISMIALTIYLP